MTPSADTAKSWLQRAMRSLLGTARPSGVLLGTVPFVLLHCQTMMFVDGSSVMDRPLVETILPHHSDLFSMLFKDLSAILLSFLRGIWIPSQHKFRTIQCLLRYRTWVAQRGLMTTQDIALASHASCWSIFALLVVEGVLSSELLKLFSAVFLRFFGCIYNMQ